MSRRAKPVSDGEMRVVNLAVKGLTDKEISAELGLSTATVRTNWVRLRRKLGVVNRAQAIACINGMTFNSQVEELAMKSRVLQAALEANDIGVMEWRDDGRILLDPQSSKHWGFEHSAVAMDEASLYELVAAEDRKALKEWHAQLLQGESRPLVIRAQGIRLRLIASHLSRMSGTSGVGGLLCTCSPVDRVFTA